MPAALSLRLPAPACSCSLLPARVGEGVISSEGTALGASLVCGGLLVFAADPPEPPRGGITAPDSKRKRGERRRHSLPAEG